MNFTHTTGLTIHTGEVDPLYAQSRALEAGSGGANYSCYGGDPSECGQGSTVSWQATLPTNTILLKYTTTPVSQLLGTSTQTNGDPSLRLQMEHAVSAYLAARSAEWRQVDKCPPSCHGHGNCSWPAQQCQCVSAPPRQSNCTVSSFIGKRG